MNNLPPFVRFHTVHVIYGSCRQSVEEQWLVFRNSLELVKPALCDKNAIVFHGKISHKNDPSEFSNRQQLLNHLGNEFLPIYNQPSGYGFVIYIDEGEIDGANYEANIIASILEMPEVTRCSNVAFQIKKWFDFIQLPVEQISNWLNRNLTNVDNGKNAENGELHLEISDISIHNALEMCNRLKQVI